MATYATYRLDCRPARDELIVESLVIPFVGSCSTYSATAATLFNSLRACGLDIESFISDERPSERIEHAGAALSIVGRRLATLPEFGARPTSFEVVVAHARATVIPVLVFQHIAVVAQRVAIT